MRFGLKTTTGRKLRPKAYWRDESRRRFEASVLHRQDLIDTNLTGLVLALHDCLADGTTATGREMRRLVKSVGLSGQIRTLVRGGGSPGMLTWGRASGSAPVS
jgi:hypothetical protein